MYPGACTERGAAGVRDGRGRVTAISSDQAQSGHMALLALQKYRVITELTQIISEARIVISQT